ncbi:hypothetical protein [Anoxybacterium hadale]
MKKKNRSLGNKKSNEIKEGSVPKTVLGQNLGHNAKKTGLGPNTDR